VAIDERRSLSRARRRTWGSDRDSCTPPAGQAGAGRGMKTCTRDFTQTYSLVLARAPIGSEQRQTCARDVIAVDLGDDQ
jgi:hypothetical protein